MKSHLVLPSAIAVGVLLVAGAASAQTAVNDPAGDKATAQSFPAQAGESDQAAVTANQSGLPASADLPAASAVSSGQVQLQSSPTAADQAYTLKAGDPNVISNAPIPDTPAARHQFGRPMSHAGKMTKPIGD